MQFSKETDFIPVPDWYYNIEYMEEQKRGYDFKEDLYVPGYFECNISKGESIVFSASILQTNPLSLKKKFNTEVGKRVSRDSYKNSLINSAEQFLVKKENGTEIIAGYPWFGSWGRDTFIALPGICLSTGLVKTGREVLETIVKKLKLAAKPDLILADDPTAGMSPADGRRIVRLLAEMRRVGAAVVIASQDETLADCAPMWVYRIDRGRLTQPEQSMPTDDAEAYP
jgi:glycogen debranching enzyme